LIPHQSEFQKLLDAARHGDAEAATTLYDRYARHLRAVVRQHLNSRAPALRTWYDSLDLVQDVMADFFTRQLANCTFERPQEMVAFLVKMTTSHFHDTVRRHRCTRRNELDHRQSLDQSAQEQPFVDPAPAAEEVFLAREMWEQLLSGRPATHQRILELKRLGFPLKEIAATLNLHERTIRRVLDQTVLPSR
jgi:RNA polymerase sigma factor (sigma-70 family)